MHSVRIAGETAPLYPAFKSIYEESFPASERREPGAQAAAFADPRYRLDAWMDGGLIVGLMGWWDFGDFRYIEHVAVAPGARSGGYGSRIMRAWLDQSDLPAYLEIERVVDETTRRRRDFYLRLGFVENPMEHIQPPYQGGGQGVPMHILSRPALLSPEEHTRFAGLMKNAVWSFLGPVA